MTKIKLVCPDDLKKFSITHKKNPPNQIWKPLFIVTEEPES